MPSRRVSLTPSNRDNNSYRSLFNPDLIFASADLPKTKTLVHVNGNMDPQRTLAPALTLTLMMHNDVENM
ncbi:uncharacterized protein V6R79_019424 [Siganus canaliculatus]